MKVFNWVRWKFPHAHSNARKENGEEKKRISSSKGMDIDHDDKHILLDDNVINNWDDGEDGLILAIGTLGFVDHNMQSHFPNHDQDAFFDHDHTHHDDDDDILSSVHAMMHTHEWEKDGNGCNEIEEVFTDHDDDIVRRRVTLADLFSESSNSDSDSDSNHDPDNHDDHKEIGKKKKDITFVENKSIFGLKKNKGFIKSKKLFKDDFRPLYVFNKLMKRMMKKRIHPDMEGKIKKEIEMQQSQDDDHDDDDHDDDDHGDDHESASSMLLIQDAMV